jgi:thiamine-phosphate pyrophosphorylase
MKPVDYTICFVTDQPLSRGRTTRDVVHAALKGGVRLIQLREKDLSESERLKIGIDLRTLCDKYGAHLLVNDSIDCARMINADGVHLGQSDEPVSRARSLLGSEAVIGVSVSDCAQAVKAQKDGASYVAVSPVFNTGSKPDAGSGVGCAVLKEIVASVSIPVIAIGGITSGNCEAISKQGAHGIAVITAISDAVDITAAAEQLRINFNKGIPINEK